jgi:hypothetical protein
MSTYADMAREDVEEMRASLYLWWWQFRVVLKRNFTNYYRNPSNVAARCFVMLLIAALQVRVHSGPDGWADRGTDSTGLGACVYRDWCTTTWARRRRRIRRCWRWRT